jgi:hypothetical protein
VSQVDVHWQSGLLDLLGVVSERKERPTWANPAKNQEKFQDISKDKFRSFLTVLKSVNEPLNHFPEISLNCKHAQQLLKRMAQFASPSMMCLARMVQRANCSCLVVLLSLHAQISEIRLKILLNVRESEFFIALSLNQMFEEKRR